MPHDEIERGTQILRLFFEKRKDGQWAIITMANVPLEPMEGDGNDLFRVQDDVFIAQSMPPIGGTRFWAIGQSIVPVVMLEPSDAPERIRCLGTGFFISCTGLLLTAAHVVIDPLERAQHYPIRLQGTWELPSDGRLGVMLAANPLFEGHGYFFREIEWAGWLGQPTDSPLPIRGLDLKLNSDTAICKVRPMPDGSPYQPLSIVQPGIRGTGLAVGKSATALGYGGMTEVIELNGGQDMRFRPFVSTGSILERFPDNITTRAASAPGPCFSASMKFPAGMSGSPIFDDERLYVHGVVSKGLQDETGLASFGYGSMIAPLLGLPLPLLDGKTLSDLLQSNDHGMPKMFIAGA